MDNGEMTESPLIPRKALDRVCGPCTECCKGVLSATIHGHVMYRGKPCHFLGCTGCMIYPDRPKDPCQDYLCQWRTDIRFPEWMQPHLSNLIVTERTYKDTRYFDCVETDGKTVSAKVVNWLILFALNNKVNIRYQIEGGTHKVGFDQTFLNATDL